MAVMTVELRHLLATNFELFDFPYDFDDQDFKKELEQHVIDHFYFHEIGQETPERFKHVFRTKWLAMIDYYNKLYNTTLLKYDPLTNYSMEEKHKRLNAKLYGEDAHSKTSGKENTDAGGQSTQSDKTTANEQTTTDEEQTRLSSDYPQQAIGAGNYASGEEKTTTQTTGERDSTSNSMLDTSTTDHSTTSTSKTGLEHRHTWGADNEDYVRSIEGITGITYQELIQRERETFINIKKMVTDELKKCFILIY